MIKYDYWCEVHKLITIEHSTTETFKTCPMCGKEIKRIFLSPPSAIIKNALPTRIGRGKG